MHHREALFQCRPAITFCLLFSQVGLEPISPHPLPTNDSTDMPSLVLTAHIEFERKTMAVTCVLFCTFSDIDKRSTLEAQDIL
jgi:hypothetical protein